ncbi:hypothetical protein ALC56_03637 [Trachymyrmex septentrionalis]|uniref:Uncharacterized protein n=1 Tax=Trachymyrmex septentrionalis TaxID=34720 RepID=A0A151JZA5_9HYME|nr:hypothetical protein ALC56_03637 [Trachymyrmex septentrionalis]
MVTRGSYHLAIMEIATNDGSCYVTTHFKIQDNECDAWQSHCAFLGLRETRESESHSNTYIRIGDPDERYGKQKRGSAGNGGAQLTKNRYISTERSAPDTRAVTFRKNISRWGNMQSISFISHIADFEVCEYACNFVLCLGASKFGASNSSEIRTALPHQIPNEDPKRLGNLRQASEERRTGIYET